MAGLIREAVALSVATLVFGVAAQAVIATCSTQQLKQNHCTGDLDGDGQTDIDQECAGNQTANCECTVTLKDGVVVPSIVGSCEPNP